MFLNTPLHVDHVPLLTIHQQSLFSLFGDDPQHSIIPKKLGDRFKTNQSKPPLVEIGGMRAKDGWVAISETGLVSCFGLSCIATGCRGK